jgi:hypothetical protein
MAMRVRVVLVLLAFLIAEGAAAGVWRVEQDGSGDFTVIQEAVDVAASGDTILIGPGRYQDLTWHAPMNGAAIAYWEDGRDLVFIGTNIEEVIFGPEAYVPNGSGPQGVHQHQQVGADATIEGITFSNLRVGIFAGEGSLVVSGSRFVVGKAGIVIQDDTPASNLSYCEVRDCVFEGLEDYSIITFTTEHAEVTDCTLDNAVVSFNDTANGIVRNCTVAGGSLVRYWLSDGLVEDCNAQCDGNDPCISVSDCDTVRIYDNIILGGEPNLDVSGPGTNAFVERNAFSWPGFANFYFHNFASVYAHDNHINRSSVLIDYIVYTTTYTDAYPSTIDLGSNYWFADGTIPGRLDELIHDGNDDPSLNIIVNYEPVRSEPVPTEKPSFGGIKALFR